VSNLDRTARRTPDAARYPQSQTMPHASDEPVVMFRHGFLASRALLTRLLTLEARGARFELIEGRYRSPQRS
jgi:hypothetical protein